MRPMKRVFALLVALPFTATGACPRSLEGIWISDGPATMDFIRDKAVLPAETVDFLRSIMGRMSITFTRREVHIVMPDTEISVTGTPQTFAGFDECKPYKVLFCSNDSIVWLARKPFAIREEATTFHFVDSDTAWIYGGSTDPATPDLHLREYFRRTR